MTIRTDFRYDPLYRVVETQEEFRIIEGTFRRLFDRLEEINNLGILPEVLRMAKYSKYEHHVGTVHQVESLLLVAENEVIPDRYELPLRLAAIFLHIGHFPFTYSTERAMLLACNLGDRDEVNEVWKYVLRVINRVLNKAELDESRRKTIQDHIFSLRDHEQLYRFFSANELIECWSTLKKKLGDLEESILVTTLRNMVDTENDGYKFLELANKADYVQRDALYFGAVRLDIAPRHLYGRLSKYRPTFATSEASLIETNLKYLSERFYNDPAVIWFTRLYEKIMAALLLSNNFDLEWLTKYTDEQFKRLVCSRRDQDDRKVRLSRTWVGRARKLFAGKVNFALKFELDELAFPGKRDVIDVEYMLVGKQESQTGLLRYPHESGLLLSIRYAEEDTWLPRSSSDTHISLSVFQDTSNVNLLPLLEVLERLSHFLSLRHVHLLRHALGKELSWTDEVRFDNGEVIAAICEAIHWIEEHGDYGKGEFVRKAVDDISSIKTYDELWHNFENSFIWRARIGHALARHLEEDAGVYEWFVEGLLSLPTRLLQYVSTRKYLDEIYDALMELLGSTTTDSSKGGIFEALWLVHRLRTQRGSFQFFFNGMVLVDPQKQRDKQDDNEFDVIELFINDEEEAECCIYACTISDDYREKNQKQITRLVDHVHEVYPNISIRASYIIPRDKNRGDWQPREISAGRGYPSFTLPSRRNPV